MTSERPDPPRRPLDQVAAFHYVTAPHAPTYRAIVEAFFEAKQRYAIELRPADVRAAVERAGHPVELDDDDAVEDRLAQLCTWGNLDRTHDTATVARIEDFYRKRYLYRLTAVGEAAHRAVRAVEETIGRSGSLQASMLVKIRDALDALAEQARGDAPDPGALFRSFHDLDAAFSTLTEEANQFIGELGRRTGAERVDEDRFALHKQALLAYISRFLDELRRLAGDIAHGVNALEAAGIDALVTVASHAPDLPPAVGDEDPAARWRRDRHARWHGVRAWFVGDGGTPTVDRLAQVAVQSVVGLTRALGRLNDRRVRPVDRAADFRTLARWFATCPDERAAHDLWHAAFGLYPPRHFHIAEDDAELVDARTSWWDATPVDVPVRLRARGRVSRSGRAAPAPDHASSRRWIAEIRRRERAQIAAATRRFADRGPLRLSALGHLETAEFDLLLALLDRALAAPRRADGSRCARTADGRLEITLEPAPDGGIAQIQTPRGRLRCADCIVRVASAMRAPAGAQKEAG